MEAQSSVEFMFNHTCNFRILADGIDPVELKFIDFGAEHGILINVPFTSFGTIQKELEK